MRNDIRILGIESSCDDTSAAIIEGNKILANLVANQEIHAEYGGVVPELASRAHQQNIVPVIMACFKKANVSMQDIDAIAYTKGPGLLGSLLVGNSFAKGLSLAIKKPLLEVNHMQAHILAHFIDDNASTPNFPFICLTVSGGHTQLVLVESALKMKVIGTTIDDAAGEAFDKAAKMMGIDYPGGPLIDKYAKEGNASKFPFKVGNMKNYDFSFSGIKTGILYFLRDQKKINPQFVEENIHDLCAGIQKSILDALFLKLEKAVNETGINEVAIAGGVSANSELRSRLLSYESKAWKVHIPKFEYCTDNAAMIAIAGKFLYQEKVFGTLSASPEARMKF